MWDQVYKYLVSDDADYVNHNPYTGSTVHKGVWNFLATLSGHTVPALITEYYSLPLCHDRHTFEENCHFSLFFQAEPQFFSSKVMLFRSFSVKIISSEFFYVHSSCVCPAETLPTQNRAVIWLCFTSLPSDCASLFLVSTSQVTFILFLIYLNLWIQFFGQNSYLFICFQKDSADKCRFLFTL